jgi:Rrf2 family iron-sulfur cluster assembly transcriptional regulator
MLDLALNAGGQPISLAYISSRQSISISHMEQLFAKLRKAALVRSVRGPGGGYRLARAPEDIYISEVIDAVVGAGSMEVDPHGQQRSTDILWGRLSGKIHSFLSGISLAQLVTDFRAEQAHADDQSTALQG